MLASTATVKTFEIFGDHFLQAGWSSCLPTKSVTAMKIIQGSGTNEGKHPLDQWTSSSLDPATKWIPKVRMLHTASLTPLPIYIIPWNNTDQSVYFFKDQSKLCTPTDYTGRLQPSLLIIQIQSSTFYFHQCCYHSFVRSVEHAFTVLTLNGLVRGIRTRHPACKNHSKLLNGN